MSLTASDHHVKESFVHPTRLASAHTLFPIFNTFGMHGVRAAQTVPREVPSAYCGRIVPMFLHVLGPFDCPAHWQVDSPRGTHVWVVIGRSQWVAVAYRWPHGTKCFELSIISYSFELCSLKRRLLRCAE